MKNGSGRVDVWLSILFAFCAFVGVLFALEFAVNASSVKINPVGVSVASTVIFTLITFLITRYYYKNHLHKDQKELARESIKKNFELLRIANRTLDNIDLKANTILNGGIDGDLDRALAHEFVQNIRNQVVEIYNSIGTGIDDWRVILSVEFEEIEKKERKLEKLVIEQMIKARRLKEIERSKASEQEVNSLRAELARLVEKQRSTEAEIISESKKLIGAPITKITDLTCPAPSQSKLDHLLKQPLFLKEYDIDVIS